VYSLQKWKNYLPHHHDQATILLVQHV
jgi:hypothetical protein